MRLTQIADDQLGCFSMYSYVFDGRLHAGVGLNTRVGTARFIGALTARLGSETQPHCGALIGALVESAFNVQSTAVRKAYTVAVAQLSKYATSKRMDKVIKDSVQKYMGAGEW